MRVLNILYGRDFDCNRKDYSSTCRSRGPIMKVYNAKMHGKSRDLLYAITTSSSMVFIKLVLT